MRIATYNVCNLHDGEMHAPPKSRRAFTSLAWVLNTLDADVVVLQEVANDGVLQRINNALTTPYAVARVHAGNDLRGFHQAVLSRNHCRSTSVDSFFGESTIPTLTGYQRNIVMHEFCSPDGRIELALLSLHLKSGYMHPGREMVEGHLVRMEEARQVVQWVNAWRQKIVDPGLSVPLLIAGDLNERVDGDAVQLLIKELELVDLVERDWITLDKRPSYSWFTKSTKARLDYLLATGACDRLVSHNSAQIHVAAAMRKASDHYPVTVDLTLRASSFEAKA